MYVGTPPNLVICYTALKPRHRRTEHQQSKSSGKKRHKQLSKAVPSATQEMKLIKFTYFSCIIFFIFCNNEHQHISKTFFLISCQNNK